MLLLAVSLRFAGRKLLSPGAAAIPVGIVRTSIAAAVAAATIASASADRALPLLHRRTEGGAAATTTTTTIAARARAGTGAAGLSPPMPTATSPRRSSRWQTSSVPLRCSIGTDAGAFVSAVTGGHYGARLFECGLLRSIMHWLSALSTNGGVQ